MTLDEDDLYASKDAFSILYEEAEKNNLDILGFSSIISNISITQKILINYLETPILLQPNVTERMYKKNENGDILRLNDVIWCYFIKTKFNLLI